MNRENGGVGYQQGDDSEDRQIIKRLLLGLPAANDRERADGESDHPDGRNGDWLANLRRALGRQPANLVILHLRLVPGGLRL